MAYSGSFFRDQFIFDKTAGRGCCSNVYLIGREQRFSQCDQLPLELRFAQCGQFVKKDPPNVISRPF